MNNKDMPAYPSATVDDESRAAKIVRQWPEWKQKIRLTKYSPERSQPMKVNSIPTLYYMRDNHTFAVLTIRANPIVARGRLQEEFDDGWTSGMLCAKTSYGDITKHIQAVIPEDIDVWMVETCKKLKGDELCEVNDEK